jgi:hypothetical protein
VEPDVRRLHVVAVDRTVPVGVAVEDAEERLRSARVVGHGTIIT